ncbi:SHOCT domain-containing protein [Cytobacillus firmus]|uniref:SHOCT domain-containing protein n=1 Tax=Cytobacillus firmus TaxID=1399 RepID=A0AA46SEA9_CYTFI|nr:SHOCT domain-containing protein [Cytobacillus firmus]UYG95333.1 SHOCT domain-containing protein [Cytobacillus firmus]
MLIIIGIILMGCIYWVFFSKSAKNIVDKELARQKEVKKRHNEKLKGIFDKENLKITQQYTVPNYSIIAVDENSQKVCFLKSNSKINNDKHLLEIEKVKYDVKVFRYKDVLESEVIIDGETVTKTSRTSQVGGAILGGILAGGVGAVIGGLSGKTSSKEKVKSIQLKVIVNDTKNPLQIINFLNEPTSIDRSNEKFTKANKEIMHWHSLFKVIIDMVDKEDKNKKVIQDNNTEYNTSNNISDEIRKLHDLFKEGIITQEEFESQKKKIIS